jgi:predicted site-specific integrase-resolvase
MQLPHAQLPDIPVKDRVAFSLSEVAALTGFAVSTLYKWMRAGRLRTRKVAGRRIVTPEALAELLVGDDPAVRTQSRPRS